MRKMLIVLMSLLLAAGAFATTISDIRTGVVSTGTVVTVSGIVTGEPYAFGGSKMYIQDGTGPNTGIYLYMGTHINNLVPDTVIVAEGEKFEAKDSKGWKVTAQDDSWASHTYGGMWVSQGGLLGAPADSDGSVAVAKVAIPAAGEYRVWVQGDEESPLELPAPGRVHRLPDIVRDR